MNPVETESDRIFRAQPDRSPVEQDAPTLDASTAGMERLRHPFHPTPETSTEQRHH